MHDDLLLDGLGDNPAALPMQAEKLILKLAEDKAVVPCRNLEVEQFARLQRCELEAEECPRPNFYRYWGGEDFDQLFTSHFQVVWSVRWKKQSLSVIHLEWETGCGGDSRDWVIASTQRSLTGQVVSIASTTSTCRLWMNEQTTSRFGRNDWPTKPDGKPIIWNQLRSRARDSRSPISRSWSSAAS